MQSEHTHEKTGSNNVYKQTSEATSAHFATAGREEAVDHIAEDTEREILVHLGLSCNKSPSNSSENLNALQWRKEEAADRKQR